MVCQGVHGERKLQRVAKRSTFNHHLESREKTLREDSKVREDVLENFLSEE